MLDEAFEKIKNAPPSAFIFDQHSAKRYRELKKRYLELKKSGRTNGCSVEESDILKDLF